jgi:hypothetical protein
MAPQIAHLLLPADLEDATKTNDLPAADLDALRSVSQWVENFVACPHANLGRDGTVCPFVPGSLQRRTLWFVPEHVAGLAAREMATLMDDYKRRFLELAPLDNDDAIYKTIIVVFPDLPAGRAGELFASVLGELAGPSYEEDGILFGPFFEGNQGTAIYNSSFRPFQSPVPFLFVRHTVLSDWKFFMDDDDQLDRWARRFGPEGTAVLGRELRQQPWRPARQVEA